VLSLAVQSFISHLHCICCSVFEVSRNFGPAVSIFGIVFQNNTVLFFSEGSMIQPWVQLADPPRPDLLAGAAGNLLGAAPPFRLPRIYNTNQQLILLCGPFALHNVRFQRLTPAL